jgi:protein SCO1/2
MSKARLTLLTLIAVSMVIAHAIYTSDNTSGVVISMADISPSAGTEMTMENKVDSANQDHGEEQKSTIGGEFNLTDHNGTEVTDQNYSDLHKLVFFGFTYCPDVCPAGLQKMTLALESVGDLANNIHPLFITIDPDRDTPEILKEYVGLYHENIIGLTGTKEQIKSVQDVYKVYSQKVETVHNEEDHSKSEYVMNHSSYIYLMSPDNELVTVFGSSHEPADIAKAIIAATSGS